MTRRRKRWIAAAAVIGAMALYSIVPMYFWMPPVSPEERHGIILRNVGWFLQTPIVVVALSLHYEWASVRMGTARILGMSLAIASSLGFFWVALIELATDRGVFVLPARTFNVSAGALAVSGIFSGIFHCGVWALGFVYPSALEDARVRTLEAEAHKAEAEKLKLEAEKLRANAELARLRSQLQPHFLFNTLNAIAGLVTRSPREARRLIGCLGDLLSDSLLDSEEKQTLEQEMKWLHRYAEILESRHAGALRFQWVEPRGTRDVLVPRLLLQPLVENAVHHGALRRDGGGEVTVRIELNADDVVCTVEDNGPGIPDGSPRSGAFGVHSVRRRLALEYAGADLRFETSALGTRAIVRLPRDAQRPAPSAEVRP